MANLLKYNTTELKGDVTITDEQGSDAYHFIVTVTGNGNGTFKNLVASYENWDGDRVRDTPFNVTGNIGTLTVYCSSGDTITIKGEFISDVTELQITNNIANTTAKSVASETGYTVIVEGTAQGMFNGAPTITYNGETHDMNVVGQTATFTIPITTECVINGEYLLGEYIPVKYNLTNCEIVGDKPVKIKTDASYTFNFKANPNSELKTIQAGFNDILGDWTPTDGTISEDKQTGTVTINVTTGASDFVIYATADVVQPPSIKNYGAINVYLVTLENLDEFSKKRFFTETNENSTGATTYTEVNLGEYVNRIKRIFADIPVGSDDVLKCGNYNTQIKVKVPNSDVISVDFGNVELTGTNGNNEDYNAQVQMFIPCRGIVSIDSKYIGKTVNLSIKVNVITGDAVAFISCNGVTFQYESFSLSRDVIYRLGTDLNVVGGQQWDEQIIYGLEPYVLITENNTVDTPINDTTEQVTIGDIMGFAQFENIDLNPVNLLIEEYNDIINKLETGVYL